MLGLDDDGYPDDASLEAIKAWDGPARVLFDAIRDIWEYADIGYFQQEEGIDQPHDEPCTIYRLHTGGWSGNESIIGALMANFAIWHRCWVSTTRGGHYVFHVRRAG